MLFATILVVAFLSVTYASAASRRQRSYRTFEEIQKKGGFIAAPLSLEVKADSSNADYVWVMFTYYYDTDSCDGGSKTITESDAYRTGCINTADGKSEKWSCSTSKIPYAFVFPFLFKLFLLF
jgi:hypothetical protein